MPWAGDLSWPLFMLSLTGIPPMVGFWGKFYLFTAVVRPATPGWPSLP